MPLIRKKVYKTRNVSKVHGCPALHLESDLFLTLLPSDILITSTCYYKLKPRICLMKISALKKRLQSDI